VNRVQQMDAEETFTLLHSARPGVSVRPEAFVEPSISFKARGILAALLCSPAGQQLRFEQVLAMSGRDGREATRSGLRELEEGTYLIVRQERGDQGRFGRTFWLVSDLPQRSAAVGGLAVNGKPVRGRKHRKTGFPSTGAPPCSSSSKELLKEKTTTTDIPDGLVYPRQLSGAERASAASLLRRCPEQSQELLDELAGAIEVNAIRQTRMAFLARLVALAVVGEFVPDRGIPISSRRVPPQGKECRAALPSTPGVAERYLGEIGAMLGRRRAK